MQEFLEFHGLQHSLSVFKAEAHLDALGLGRRRVQVAADVGLGKLDRDLPLLEQLVDEKRRRNFEDVEVKRPEAERKDRRGRPTHQAKIFSAEIAEPLAEVEAAEPMAEIKERAEKPEAKPEAKADRAEAKPDAERPIKSERANKQPEPVDEAKVEAKSKETKVDLVEAEGHVGAPLAGLRPLAPLGLRGREALGPHMRLPPLGEIAMSPADMRLSKILSPGVSPSNSLKSLHVVDKAGITPQTPTTTAATSCSELDFSAGSVSQGTLEASGPFGVQRPLPPLSPLVKPILESSPVIAAEASLSPVLAASALSGSQEAQDSTVELPEACDSMEEILEEVPEDALLSCSSTVGLDEKRPVEAAYVMEGSLGSDVSSPGTFLPG